MLTKTNPNMTIEKCDFLVIGAGLAGLYLAQFLKDQGKVHLITKGSLKDSNSYLAQGGIAVALNPGDSVKSHYEDTLKAGNFLNNPEHTQILVAQGKNQVLELIKLGVNFDQDSHGRLHFAREGAHSYNRILHGSGDSTGQVICEKLTQLLIASPKITIFENTPAISLLTEKKRCFGAIAWNNALNSPIAFLARHIILATGGLTGIFTLSTANPTITGDGLMLAKKAGTQLDNLQFVQFHPTALALPSANGFLISEALRGEGAYLVNAKQERFMEKYHPMLELAPRDVVSRAIWQEMTEADADHVYLATSHLDSNKLAARFPKIFNTCLEHGLTLGRDLIPVKPAAHYSIGGVATNSHGETGIASLYAVGEAAFTGVHGSNRLASNSLLECLVFSSRAAMRILQETSDKHSMVGGEKYTVNLAEEKAFQLGLTTPAPVSLDQDKVFSKIVTNVSQIVYDNLGIVRSGENLVAAANSLSKLLMISNSLKLSPVYHHRLVNIITLALELTNHALTYPRNTGCHYLISGSNHKGVVNYAKNSC
ncbi:MAG: L-aspartate oxidase [Clostridia bacterium]|nr:L-aspartate oxidase [Clostridia bacterium]